MQLILVSGAGNRFALVDVPRSGGPADPSGWARFLCDARAGHDLPPLDGLLLLESPVTSQASARMVLYNADGSRPEACGNGLRCVAGLARERGHSSTDTFVVDTDAGPREVTVEWDASRTFVVGAQVSMGPVGMLEADAAFDGLPPTSDGSTSCRASLATVGNPHAVLLVDDERLAPVAAWGPAIERHPRFPAGTNVGFLAQRGGELHLRVWERGVGETAACGSGACAAASVAWAKGLVRPGLPVALHLAGGRLVVEGDPDVDVRLSGPVETLRTVELDEPTKHLEAGSGST